MKIPYGRQNITAKDIAAVNKVLKSDYLTQGTEVPKFEESISKYVSSKYAVAFNSATSALHAACMALGLTTKSTVWTSPISFVASANCALYIGANIDFVDININTRNICPTKLEEKLVYAKKANILPDLLIVVHLSGLPSDLDKIYKLSKRFGFKIIEDASHAIGAEFMDERIGSCRYSDITIFSFHPVKIITTGEGGIATTNSSRLADALSLFRSHGITRDNKKLSRKGKPSYYEQIALGYNYRLTDFQAALGSSQLQRINGIIAKRNKIAKRYIRGFNNCPIVLPSIPNNALSSWHLFIINLLTEDQKIRDEFLVHLQKKGIQANIHYIPIHLHPFYKNMGFKEGMFPIAESYYKSAITLPIFPELTKIQQDFVIKTIKEYLS